MSKYANLVNFFKQCPQLEELWSIAAIEERDVNVILPVGASQAMQITESEDVNGVYTITKEPFVTVYEDFQINCYKFYDANDSTAPDANVNVLGYDEVQSICDWIKKQDEDNNFPDIGHTVVSLECEPFTPQIQDVNDTEEIVSYFITVRVRYLNPFKRKVEEYALED